MNKRVKAAITLLIVCVYLFQVVYRIMVNPNLVIDSMFYVILFGCLAWYGFTESKTTTPATPAAPKPPA